MRPPGADTVLVRHGDINMKSQSVKRSMEERLASNLESMLEDRGVSGTVERRWSRPLIHTTSEDIEDALTVASESFGVVSASAAVTTEPTLEAVFDALRETAKTCYHSGTFAVRARRSDKRLPFSSQDIEREGGAVIWETVSDRFDPSVDLDNPDLTFHVEVRDDIAFVFLSVADGPGGLPLGSQAPVVALISGGIDSPVAAYEIMRRGSEIHPIYFDLGDYGGPDHEARAIETVRSLSRYVPGTSLTVTRVPAGETVSTLVETMEQGRMVALRRFFFHAAEQIADDLSAMGIVTGEALGQKSSQTASNFMATNRATRMPIFRPLLTRDKQDIIRQSKAIGTYTDSQINAGCNRIAPDRVSTRISVDRIERIEPEGLFERAKTVAASTSTIDV